jgi:hypothetical protein
MKEMIYRDFKIKQYGDTLRIFDKYDNYVKTLEIVNWNAAKRKVDSIIANNK